MIHKVGSKKVGHLLQNSGNDKKCKGLPEHESVSKGVPSQFASDTPRDALAPEDILTPEQLAQRLQVSKSWVFEQTRDRAKIRNKNPLPCIRLGKYLRFSWVAVCDWMSENSR